jgi:hypothetical protein
MNWLSGVAHAERHAPRIFRATYALGMTVGLEIGVGVGAGVGLGMGVLVEIGDGAGVEKGGD